MANNALPSKFQAVIDSLTNQEAQQIIAMLQHVGRLALPRMLPRSGVEKSEKKQQGPKRPLNSWLAFRSFYEAMLLGIPQKWKSKLLRAFWREDLFEAKWVILAKAYSIARGDRTKQEAPLGEFFTHCAALVGVIPPNEYQGRMGWNVIPAQSSDAEPQAVRLFVPSLADLPGRFTTTVLGVDDLVSHCYEVGYVKTDITNPPNTSAQDTLTMVVAPPAGQVALESAATTLEQLGTGEEDYFLAFGPGSIGPSVINFDLPGHDDWHSFEMQIGDYIPDEPETAQDEE